MFPWCGSHPMFLVLMEQCGVHGTVWCSCNQYVSHRLCVCTYTSTHVHGCTCVYVCVPVCTSVYVWVCVCVCGCGCGCVFSPIPYFWFSWNSVVFMQPVRLTSIVRVYVHVHTRTWLYACVPVCTSVYQCVCVCVCVCVWVWAIWVQNCWTHIMSWIRPYQP